DALPISASPRAAASISLEGRWSKSTVAVKPARPAAAPQRGQRRSRAALAVMVVRSLIQVVREARVEVEMGVEVEVEESALAGEALCRRTRRLARGGRSPR